MRSSIACARCRRSKVKCVNNGIGTTCRACETTGRECTYPVPSAGGGGGGGGVRRESGEPRQFGEGIMSNDTPKRQRPKKLTQAPPNVSTKESMRALVDALDPAVLTPQVWIDLFDIWQLHFSTDLPFIHPPTFLKPLRQMQQAPSQPPDFSSPRNPATCLPPASPVLLLGFLALTARFHEKLVAHHSPPSASRPSNPLIASQYYAAAAKARLAGNSGDGLGLPEGARIQALLMLALHEWGNCQGVKSWISLGVAVRYAQVLGLQYQLDLDDEPQSRSRALELENSKLGSMVSGTSPGSADDFIEQETKRRTFWSCYIMDRYLSSGKYRPQMLHVRDIRLQLPSSERSFLFGEQVRTALLSDEPDDTDLRPSVLHSRRASSMHGGSNGDSASTPRHNFSHSDSQGDESEQNGRWEVGASEGVLSRYIKAIDLYGHIIRWSCGGGRRRERYPPWERQSQWHILQSRVSHFIDRLPRDLALSPANIQAHIASRTSTPYILLHSVLLLCKVMLHREYIPFVPLRCTRPQGPLDPPLFPPDQYQIPPGFWEESANELFKSARNLMDLAQTCHEWSVFPETPIVGFAIYTVAFVGVYAINFPWMDPNGYMCKKTVRPGSREAQSQTDDDSGAVAARQALRMIGLIRRRLKMADGWFRTIGRVHKYFVRVKKDFRRNAKSLAEASFNIEQHIPWSLRDDSGGGGLEEFKMIEMTLKEFGSLEDEDLEMTDAPDMGDGAHAGSSAASTAVKSDGYGLQERTPESGPVRQDRWNAINSMGTVQQPTEATAATNGTNTAYFPTPMAGASGATTGTNAMQQHPISTSTGTSPLISPPGFGQGHFPPHLPQQPSAPAVKASASLQQQMQLSHPPTPVMTAEQTESWLNGLDTRFSADDVTAFVEGTDWQDWAAGAAGPPGTGGWLSTIWASAPNT